MVDDFISDEMPAKNIKLLDCTVERVHDSGLVDVRPFEGGELTEINLIITGTENFPKEGEDCVILSDGAKYFYLGKVREPVERDGAPTVRNRKNDLSSLDDAKSLVSADDYGNFARLAVSKGGGIVADSGETCVTHWHPGKRRKCDYVSESEWISDPEYSRAIHDGDKCEIVKKWRTHVDPGSVKRDYEHTENVKKDKKGTARVEISPGNHILEFETRQDGSKKTAVDIGKNGSVHIESNNTEVDIDQGGNVSIDAKGDIDLDADGRIRFGAKAGELLQKIIELIGQIEVGTVATSNGPQPFMNLPAFTQLKNILQNMKKP